MPEYAPYGVTPTTGRPYSLTFNEKGQARTRFLPLRNVLAEASTYPEAERLVQAISLGFQLGKVVGIEQRNDLLCDLLGDGLIDFFTLRLLTGFSERHLMRIVPKYLRDKGKKGNLWTDKQSAAYWRTRNTARRKRKRPTPRLTLPRGTPKR